MSDLKFYPLKIKAIRHETQDCIALSLDVPQSLKNTFQFKAGQYVTFKANVSGVSLRRSYSICSSPSSGELQVAVKRVENGRFSNFAHDVLKVGDILETMPPMGNFTPRTYSGAGHNYVAFAAGSGVTPILSILKDVLEQHPDNQFTLVYGNRDSGNVIFKNELDDLQNSFAGRLRLLYVYSREQAPEAIQYGRIDAGKSRELCKHHIDLTKTSEIFICGPEQMLFTVRNELTAMGYDAHNIHIELFTAPEQPKPSQEDQAGAQHAEQAQTGSVTVILDGNEITLDIPFNGLSILDEANKQGADLPYACKSGVCCTCRAKVTQGKVEMTANYALEPDEVEAGYVLVCQCHPRSATVVVDFDAR
jgi:ring-1,2-phenylacetyl-CoA epoxidase subunit PaaE